MSIEVFWNRDARTISPLDAKLFGCHSAVLAQSGSGKSFMIGRLIEELILKTKARVIVLDPNSDFVRLPEVDESAWNRAELQPWFFPGDTVAAFKSRWEELTLVLSNRNLSRTRPLRINWGELTDRDRADVMDIDPAANPELYWALVLASEVARARWNEDLEAYFDFDQFRTVAYELCDFLLGSLRGHFDTSSGLHAPRSGIIYCFALSFSGLFGRSV
jgi:DNA helicase HerA-like ATPase